MSMTPFGKVIGEDKSEVTERSGIMTFIRTAVLIEKTKNVTKGFRGKYVTSHCFVVKVALTAVYIGRGDSNLC